jgi:hypothetical protein
MHLFKSDYLVLSKIIYVKDNLSHATPTIATKEIQIYLEKSPY